MTRRKIRYKNGKVEIDIAAWKKIVEALREARKILRQRRL